MSLIRGHSRPVVFRFDAGAVAHAAPGRRARLALVATSLFAIAGAADSQPAGDRWSRVPAAAQGAISGALGRDDPAYYAFARPGGLRAQNRRHGLAIDFSREGVRVEDGTDRLDLSLQAVGYGERLSTVTAAAPSARANRVEYCRESMTEWYVNGPFGFEQGFTLDAPPGPRETGPLTMELAITGDFDPSLDGGGGTLVLARRGGGAALTYGGLTAMDRAGRELPIRLELAGDVLRLQIDDLGASYPIVVDPFLKKATLIASDDKPEDFFGISVAISGDTILVGAYNPPHLDDFLPGAAYVFVKPVSGWSGTLTETAKLTGSDADSGSWFGFRVALSGDTAAVAATLHKGANGSEGVVYVFVRPPGGWTGTLTENAKLTASDGSADDQFGTVLTTDGETVVVGLPDDPIGGMLSVGSAYVFSKPAGGWTGSLTESARLTASNSAEFDQFGVGLGVGGDTVAVGASRHDGFKIIVGPTGTQIVPIPDQGEVFVFTKPAGGWSGAVTENARLDPSDPQSQARFGISVGVSGDAVFAGAPGAGIAGEGAGYVFVKPASGWSGLLVESARLVASDPAPGDGLGGLAAASGSSVLFSADEKKISYLFVQPSSGWSSSITQKEKAAFCCNFAFSGKTAVVGDDSSEQATVWGAPPNDQAAPAPKDPNGGNSWYNSSVHLTVTSTDDGGPGVAETRCALDPPSPPRVFEELSPGCAFADSGADVRTDGRHALYVSSRDLERAESTPSVTSFQIDQTPPELVCDAGASFLLRGPGGIVTASVRDATSGPAASPVSAAVTAAEAAAAGVRSKDLAGSDLAGNGAKVSCSYVVRYGFPGFLRPRRGTFPAGASIPVRFKLTDASGTPIPDRDARALASACNVKITFTGGNPAPGCAHYDGRAFTLDVRTSRRLAPGDYLIGAEVFAGGSAVNRETVEVAIR